MKKKLLLLLGVCLVVTSASSAFAAVMLKRLGDHPFCRPAMTTEAELRTMFDEQSADLQDGFVKAGNPELYAEFKAQFPTAEIEVIRIAPGQHMEWMLFRKNGTGPVKAVRDVTWDGEAAFDAYRFHIDKDGQRYAFIVPTVCGNLSLLAVEAAPAQVEEVNQAPVCDMSLSSSEIACGQVITVDAGGSSDPDGSISEVVFQLLDASNTVVIEKIDKEAPFVQEFTVPCESSSYTVKTVVIDNKGAQSTSADCTQTVTVARRMGGPVVDVGLSHQFDPASYVFARAGYEILLAEKLTAMGLIGGFVRFDGDDGDASVFTADALLNYYFNEKLFVGGGLGFWSGNDGKVDLIVNTGYLIHEKPGVLKTSIFVEGRCEIDELVSSNASRLGAGLRFQF